MDDTSKNLENLALDVIRFLQKWGLWRNVCIYTGGRLIGMMIAVLLTKQFHM